MAELPIYIVFEIIPEKNGTGCLVEQAADVKPVVRGEWIEDLDGFFYCSQCKATDPLGTKNYCPNCGADMRGENNDNG